MYIYIYIYIFTYIIYNIYYNFVSPTKAQLCLDVKKLILHMGLVTGIVHASMV